MSANATDLATAPAAAGDPAAPSREGKTPEEGQQAASNDDDARVKRESNDVNGISDQPPAAEDDAVPAATTPKVGFSVEIVRSDPDADANADAANAPGGAQRDRQNSAFSTGTTIDHAHDAAPPTNEEFEDEGEDMMDDGGEDVMDGGDEYERLLAAADVGGGDGAEKKPAKRRALRSASEITQEELSSCFHLPSEAACRKLGIGLTVLKRQCRRFGIKRWPFRKMKSLDRLITNVQAGISPGDQNRTLVKSVEELEEQKRRMEECQVLDLDDNTKRLQQAYSKANHKARRLAAAPEMNGVGGLLALTGGGAPSPPPEKKPPRAKKARNQPTSDAVNDSLEAAKAQARLLQGVAATLPSLLPGGIGDLDSHAVAAAVAAAAAAMSQHAATPPPVNFAASGGLAAALAAREEKLPPHLRQKGDWVGASVAAAAAAAAAGGRKSQQTVLEAANPFPPHETTTTPRANDDVSVPVSGAWSPARPASRQHGEEEEDVEIEAILARANAGTTAIKQEESSSEESESESEPEPEEEEEVLLPDSRTGRKRKMNPKFKDPKEEKKKKRKKKKKKPPVDELESLAAAALAGGLAGKGGRGGRGGRGRGGGRGSRPSGETRGGRITLAAALAKADALAARAAAGLRPPQLPEEHPGFAPSQRSRYEAPPAPPPGFGLAGLAPVEPAAPTIDKSAITSLVTEHADRLREVMTRAGVDAQTVAEAIGGEALKLRDALDALLLPA